MKKLLIIILLSQAFHTFAASVVYKVASSGNDANNGITAPWKTLAKVNAMQSSLNAGDMVLFNRGDVFYGNLIVSKSGTSGNPIIYGAYGSGSNPIITGFTNVSSFTQISTNVWESNTLATNISGCNLVNINGVNIQMGRIPNTGYYTYSSHTGSGTGVQARSITSSSLNSAITNWTGAELALCMSTYTIGRDVITSASGSTINFTSASVDEDIQKDGQRFIIQNDPRTLDQQGEWYYNPATKKIRFYSVGSPTGVQVSTIDTTINISSQNYITIDGLDIEGANQNLIFIGNSNHITIQNCNLNFSGRDGIFGPFWNVSTYLNINNCTINNVNNTAIDVSGSFTNNSITDNSVTNCGQQFGMGNNGNTGNGLGSYSGILIGGGTTVVQNNSIDNVAYNGIRFHGDNTTIQNNFINHSCNNLTDGGAIYTDGDNTTSSNLKILGNIGLNGGDNGIYLDAQTNHVEIGNNTLSGFARAAYFINQDHDINLHDNTAYDNTYDLWVDNTDPNYTTSNITITGNKFIGKSASQTTALYNLIGNTIPATLLPDYNYYARPIDDNLTLLTYLSGVYTNRNLAMWQTLSGKDLNSKKSPIAITNVNKLLLIYSLKNDSTIILPAGTWIDVENTTYNTGSVFLPTYTSKVLINTGTNVAPIADAGTDKNITLPTNSVTVNGSGSDPDGTIASYVWKQISGTSTVTFGSANSATTTINGLNVADTYSFQLKVTDNFGLTGVDTMFVVVNASAPVNLPPVVNAGGNKNITLPTSSLTQSGSATDPDGTIVSYAWTQGINPTTATIASPTSAVTVISGMTVAGTYSFTLTATDNSGATGSQTITVIVNTAAPIAPIANAGSDQSITWPVNSVSLSGSGTDADGVIVAYNWSKLSGANAVIANPNSQNTSVTFPQQGTYIFQLKVTDNSGLTGTDNVQVVVNKGTVTISFSAPTLTQTWTGLPLAPTVITSPANVPYSILYNGIGATPIEPNSYSTTAATTDGNYVVASVSGTFTINKAIATFTITNTSQYYNGNPLVPFVTTNPANLTGVNIASPHTNPGTYSDVITLNNIHYQANPVTIPFVITTAGASMTITGYQNKFYTGGQISVVPVTNPAGLTYTVTYGGSATPPTNAGTYQVIATITQVGYSGSDTVSMTINKASTTNTLTWQPIANVQEGTVLTTQQLNAYSSLPGTFEYDLPLGYLLNEGIYRITGTFYPTDSANYSSSNIQNTLIVYGSPILQILILHGRPYPLDYPQ